MSSSPRTTREALVAELLGDVDGLLTRVEALPASLSNTVEILNEASDKYRMAATTFTEQAKADLSYYLDLKINILAQTAEKTVAEQRAALQEAALLAFPSDAAERLVTALGKTATGLQRSILSRIIENAVTAIISSAFTFGFIYLIIK